MSETLRQKRKADEFESILNPKQQSILKASKLDSIVHSTLSDSDLFVRGQSTPHPRTLDPSFTSFLEKNKFESGTFFSAKSLNYTESDTDATEMDASQLQSQNAKTDEFLAILGDDRVKQAMSNIFTTSLQTLRETVHTQGERLNSVEERLDALEQQNRNFFLLFDGIRSETPDDLQNRIKSLCATRLNVVLQDHHIEFAGRTGQVREGAIRPVIVKFSSVSIKTKVYLARMRLRGSNDGVFIREFLTKYRAEVAFQLRQAKRDNQIAKHWTFNGDNYIIIANGGSPVMIKSIPHFRGIISAPLA